SNTLSTAILQTGPGAPYDPAMGMPRALCGAVCVLTVALLAACQPWPAPEGAAQAYLDAWARADYGAMYALVDGATRGQISVAAFADRYEAVARAAALRAVRASLGPRADLDGDHARFTVTARWDTARVGSFECGEVYEGRSSRASRRRRGGRGGRRSRMAAGQRLRSGSSALPDAADDLPHANGVRLPVARQSVGLALLGPVRQ